MRVEELEVVNTIIDGSQIAIEIDAVVIDLMKSGEPFTSVDISNKIKRTLHVFVRNSAVSTYLKGHWYRLNDEDGMKVYYLKNIFLRPGVCGILYFPQDYNPSDYVSTEEFALTPQSLVEWINDEERKKNKPPVVVAKPVVIEDDLSYSTSTVPRKEGPIDCLGSVISVGDWVVCASRKKRGEILHQIFGYVDSFKKSDDGSYSVNITKYDEKTIKKVRTFTVNNSRRIFRVEDSFFGPGQSFENFEQIDMLKSRRVIRLLKPTKD